MTKLEALMLGVNVFDPRIKKIVFDETARQDNTVELIASENFTSPEIMGLCGSILTNKYAEGLPRQKILQWL